MVYAQFSTVTGVYIKDINKAEVLSIMCTPLAPLADSLRYSQLWKTVPTLNIL